MPGAPADPASPRLAIVGAGIAGASLARAARRLGLQARIFAHGAMASGNPAALVSPRLAAGSGVPARLHAQAFLRSVALVRREAPEAVIAEGAIRRLKPNEIARAEATIASGLFPQGSLRLQGDALHMADALVISPGRLRAIWLGEVEEGPVEAPRHMSDGWWLGTEGPFDALLLAAGYPTAALSGLPLRPIRGQVSTAALPPGAPPTSWGGYLIPTEEGLLFGATHGRGDADPSIRADDQASNLAGLARAMPDVAARLEGAALGAAAGVRAAAGDHQPMAGTLGSGRFALTALGGRGFALAPLLAEQVAALAAGVAPPLAADCAKLVDPRRFDSN
nr:FAD-dependent oxidoreductase [Sandaracinobacteroides sayramensis]